MSNPSMRTSLRSSYSETCFWKKPFSIACSIPTALASCEGLLAVKTMRVWAARVAWMRGLGPASHPTLQPVAEKVFPWGGGACQLWRGTKAEGGPTADPTVTVRRQKLSRAAMRTCSLPLSTRASYCVQSQRGLSSEGSKGRTKDARLHRTGS